MRVLVTGCCGFIGHATITRMKADGHEVLGVDKISKPTSNKEARVADLKLQGIRVVDLNISNWVEVRKLLVSFKPEIVFHIAALTATNHTVENFLAYVEGNLMGASYVFEASHLAGVQRMIYTSSTLVVPSRLPPSMYAATKEFGERFLNVYANMGMEVICLRPPTTYGPLGRLDSPVGCVTRAVVHSPSMNVPNFNARLSYLYIDDAAEVMSRCASVSLKEKYNSRFMVGHLPKASLAEIMTIIEGLVGRKIKRIGDPGPEVEVSTPDKQADALDELIGYTPNTPLEVGLERFVKWYKTNPAR